MGTQSICRVISEAVMLWALAGPLKKLDFGIIPKPHSDPSMKHWKRPSCQGSKNSYKPMRLIFWVISQSFLCWPHRESHLCRPAPATIHMPFCFTGKALETTVCKGWNIWQNCYQKPETRRVSKYMVKQHDWLCEKTDNLLLIFMSVFSFGWKQKNCHNT